jgi:spermidine/putrescine transport system substrate-binding protein
MVGLIQQVRRSRRMAMRLDPVVPSCRAGGLRGLGHMAMVVGLALLTACSEGPSPTPQNRPERLVFYDREEDMPRSVLDAFQAEFGVKVEYRTYESQEEAIESLRAGGSVDVAVIEGDAVAPLLAEGHLAELDFRHIPNSKNVFASFRDLLGDPGNRYAVPYHYGATGMLVRTDLLERAPTSWADLWDPGLVEKVAVRAQRRELIAITLLSLLGYTTDSLNPAELETAARRLAQLGRDSIPVDSERTAAVPVLWSGEAVILVGGADDYRFARTQSKSVEYVLPREGGLLWSEVYVVSAHRLNQRIAEALINFLLRPGISAEIANTNHYASANAAATPYIDPQLRNEPATYPPPEHLRYAPPSAVLEESFAPVWERFLQARVEKVR